MAAGMGLAHVLRHGNGKHAAAELAVRVLPDAAPANFALALFGVEVLQLVLLVLVVLLLVLLVLLLVVARLPNGRRLVGRRRRRRGLAGVLLLDGDQHRLRPDHFQAVLAELLPQFNEQPKRRQQGVHRFRLDCAR